MSSARQSARSLLAALAAGDVGVVDELLGVDLPAQEPLRPATAEMLVAGRRLATAATKLFGPAGNRIGAGPIVPTDAPDIDRAEERAAGDVVELYLPGHSIPMKFRRFASQWKLWIGEGAPTDPDAIEKQAALLRLLTSAFLESATELESGRYATVEDAEAAIKQKLNFVLMRHLGATTHPTTTPASPRG